MCETTSLVDCAGTCEGVCEVAPGDAGCPDDSTVVGECAGTAENGSCRGHLYPSGCDGQCPNCDAARIVDDCRETAKLSAWSAITCGPAEVRLSFTFSPDAPDIVSLLHKARTLERFLRQMAASHAWLRLLVDGEDDAGGLLPDALLTGVGGGESGDSDDKYLAYFESEEGKKRDAAFAVDRERLHLPLENLKARFAWLREIAIDSEWGYRISAGAFPCLEPSLDEAFESVQTMIPVTKSGGGDSIVFTADRGCMDAEPGDDVPCLYQLLDRQSAYLALLLE